jgi:hypothetical protein
MLLWKKHKDASCGENMRQRVTSDGTPTNKGRQVTWPWNSFSNLLIASPKGSLKNGPGGGVPGGMLPHILPQELLLLLPQVIKKLETTPKLKPVPQETKEKNLRHRVPPFSCVHLSKVGLACF